MPGIRAILWSDVADRQLDALDCDTEDAVQDALRMLRSDGIDGHNRRTKLLKMTEGKVIEVRLRSGRNPFRLLYIHHSPEVIEIIRVCRTSAEDSAAFKRAVKAAQDAARQH